MAGGAADDIARIAPLMADVAARFTHMGPVGSGLVAKMINQLIVGCGHAVHGRGAACWPKRRASTPRAFPECLAGGHADGTLLQQLYPRMAARDFAPQGYARQLLKDLEMVNEFAGGLQGAGADDRRGAVALPDAGPPRLRGARHGRDLQAVRTRRAGHDRRHHADARTRAASTFKEDVP